MLKIATCIESSVLLTVAMGHGLINDISLCLYLLSIVSCVFNVEFNQTVDCPLWHIPVRDHSGHIDCVCGARFKGIISCDGDRIYIKHGYCLTWNNSTNSAEIHRCLLIYWDFNGKCTGNHLNTYHVPVSEYFIQYTDYCKNTQLQRPGFTTCKTALEMRMHKPGLQCV